MDVSSANYLLWITAAFFHKKCSLYYFWYIFSYGITASPIHIHARCAACATTILLPAPHFEPYNQTAGFSPMEDAPIKPAISFKRSYGCNFLWKMCSSWYWLDRFCGGLVNVKILQFNFFACWNVRLYLEFYCLWM